MKERIRSGEALSLMRDARRLRWEIICIDVRLAWLDLKILWYSGLNWLVSAAVVALALAWLLPA